MHLVSASNRPAISYTMQRNNDIDRNVNNRPNIGAFHNVTSVCFHRVLLDVLFTRGRQRLADKQTDHLPNRD